MKGFSAAVLALILGLAAPWSAAKVEVLSFDTAEQEQRYNTLIKELRCLVCQNQNLADSNATLAQDLRRKTYEMIDQGLSDDEIVDYMVERYGDFVLYRPPVKTSTAMLWVGPFIALLIALVVVFRMISRRRKAAADGLAPEHRQKVQRLLHEDD